MEEAKITPKEANRLLDCALQNGNMARAEEAIYKGADLRRGGYRLLELAARKGKRKIVSTMLQQATKEELNNFALLACNNNRLALLLDIQAAGGKVRIDEKFVLKHQDTLRWLSRAGIKAQIILEAFKVAEDKHEESPELLRNLLTVMKKSENPEKYQRILNFLLAENARKDRLELVKLYEKHGGDVKSIPYMDIDNIKKRGGGSVWVYLSIKGVDMRLFF